MSDVTERASTAVATNEANPYAQYGAKVGSAGGNFLIFDKGEFYAGQERKEVSRGTKMIVCMEGFRIGWRRWWNNSMVEDRTELLTEYKPPAPRSALGDTDQALWERDRDNQPRDPWQLTNVVEMVDNQRAHYTYAATSKGGIGALGKLCTEYGKLYRQKPGQLPIVELGRDSYTHKNASYGRIFTPVFTIVDWIDEGEALAESDAKPAEPPPPVKQTKF